MRRTTRARWLAHTGLTVTVALMVLGCGTPESTTGPASGITGRTTVDSGCPPTPARDFCPRLPLAAHLTVTRAAPAVDQVLEETDTGEDGTFTIGVPPGSYVLQAVNRTGTPMPSAGPISVTVPAGQIANIEIRFDSGVR